MCLSGQGITLFHLMRYAAPIKLACLEVFNQSFLFSGQGINLARLFRVPNVQIGPRHHLAVLYTSQQNGL